MSYMDRTQEFNSVAENIRSKQNSGKNSSSYPLHLLYPPPLPHDNNNSSSSNNKKKKRSQFSITASKIGKEIYETSEKLDKLTKLAKKKSLFDDPAVEIEELTFIIKQNIQNLNKDITTLREYSKNGSNNTSNSSLSSSSSKQNTTHSDTVVTYLNSKLASTTKDFKDILQIRTENLKSQHERRQRFTGSTHNSFATRSTSDSVLYKPQHDNVPEGSPQSGGEVAITMPQMLIQQDEYSNSRATAVENIERTIVELGGIFQQLAALVAEQGDMLQRIDDNIDNSNLYVDRGHSELLKALHNISGNRPLIFKLFLVLIIFAVIFIVFFV